MQTSTTDEPSPRIHRVTGSVVFWGIVLVSLFVLIYNLGSNTLYVDEKGHLLVALMFSRGENHEVPWNLPMWPAYHLMLAPFFRLAGLTHLKTVQQASEVTMIARTVTVGMGLLSIIFFHGCARHLAPRQVRERTLQYLWCPLIFPYFGLIFTDVPALMFTLLTFYLVLRRWYWPAAMAALAAIAVRQLSVVWVVFCLVYAARQEYMATASLRQTLKRVLPLALSLALVSVIFARFGLVYNQAARAMHKPGLYVGNIYMVWACWTVLFFPLLVAYWPRVWGVLKRPACVLAVSLGYPVFLRTFYVSEKFNQPAGYLTNDIVHYVLDSVGRETVFYLIAVTGLVLWIATRLMQEQSWIFYPAFLLYLLPLSIIGLRYEMTGIAFFLLLRPEDTSTSTEKALTGFLLAATVLEFVTMLSAHPEFPC